MNIDLTLKLQDAIIERPELTEKYKQLVTLGHFGTHIDTHLETEIPLDYIQSRGIFFDVSHTMRRDIELSDFDHQTIKAHDFVIFKTGMMDSFGYGTHGYFKNHTQLADSTIDYLIHKNIRFIGIDAAGVRHGIEHIAADKKCEANGIYIVENLTNIQNLSEQHATDFQVFTLWVENINKTGLPCRIVARF
ncbi:MAG: cyclase family protein [Legionellaceae bacterium]|nr:cyclase family protein [Legionellaceae bacterium]